MKKLMLIAFLFAITYLSNAQKIKEQDVPAAVKSALTAMYPDAKHIKWSMEDGKYEGEFKINKTEYSALYNESGSYVQTEMEIPVSSLPQEVSDYVKNNLAGKKIKEAAKITDAAGTVTYEAEVEGTDYLFDSGGKFLSKSTDSDSEDEK